MEMRCVNCEGTGCNECNKTGFLSITSCPLELITNDIYEVIKLAELYEKGLPPVAGGALDQAKIFIEAAMFIFSEKAYWKRKLGIFD